MAYMIHITSSRKRWGLTRKIPLKHWIAAVNRIDGVRLAEGDYSIQLPETGQTFVLRNNGGDAELYIPHADEWRRVFRWDEESIQFVGTEEFGADPGCQLRSIARALAAELGAELRGDDGEIYD
jgi:hypothetical protein